MAACAKLAKLRKNKTAGFSLLPTPFGVSTESGIVRIDAGAETLLTAGMKFGAVGEQIVWPRRLLLYRHFGSARL